MKKKIVIIGAGNIGMALASSLPTDTYDVVCTDASEHTIKRLSAAMPDITFTRDNVAAVKDADIVVIALKPYIAGMVMEEIKNHLHRGTTIVSVVAPVPTSDIVESLDAKEKGLNVIKVIPNTAIRKRRSVTFVTGSECSTKESVDEVMELFSLSGKTYHIAEKDMNACCVVASCGIAFFLRFIHACAEGCVEFGLHPSFATEIAALTAVSAAALLEDGEHPEAEIDKVTTPGGSTIRGLNALDTHGFNAAVIAALKASAGE